MDLSNHIPRTKTFKRGHFQFYEDPTVHASHWSFTDEDSVRDAWWDITPGQVVADIGCAYGSYAMHALAMGASKVIAWSPESYKEKFLANADINGWLSNVEFHDLGLWSQSGWLQIFDHAPMPKFFSEKPSHEGIIFEVKTLDHYSFERLDWIKIDVEGCEVDVLQGAFATLARHRPKILVENHLFKDPTINQRCEDMIKQSGVAYLPRQEMPYHSISHSLFIPA